MIIANINPRNPHSPGAAIPPGQINATTKGAPSKHEIDSPPCPFLAYLFDCDGTIADSMPLHYIAWKQALGEWGCTFDEELFYTWGGKPAAKIIADLNQMQGLHMPVESLAEHKENLYFELLPELKPVPEVLEIIEAQHGRIPFAVVSGGRRNSVVGSLTTLDLMDRFETIVGAEDYQHGKPAPDAYLIAAARLGVAPRDCLVFEDTDMGIEAATAAGMASVKIPSPLERSLEKRWKELRSDRKRSLLLRLACQHQEVDLSSIARSLQSDRSSVNRRTQWPILLGLAAAVALLHILTNGRYGFHRDELQFLSDARHLDWGFVAYPPLTPFLEHIGLAIFGVSLVGLRLFSLLAQAVVIVVAGLMAKELGGARLAQFTAALAVALSPIPMFSGTEFQYTSFDFLWWVLDRLLRHSPLEY